MMNNFMRIFTKREYHRLLRQKISLAMTPKNTSAFTLVEILFALLILSISLTSAIVCITSSIAATQLSRDMTTAANHAEQVLEEMKTLTTLASITSTNWTTWASTNGLNTLTNEALSVTYVNQAANPLSITVTVTWTTKSRTQTVNLTTEMTR